MKTDEIIKNIERIEADLVDIWPEGIGRFDFIGCFLSKLISIISLKIYTELEIKQKQIKTIKVENQVIKENSNVKNVAAKINKFFVHCLGLHVFRRAFKFLFLINIDFMKNFNN